MAKLSKKQQLFADEYLIDLNATQAAIRAGYSVKSAREQGHENLTKPNIAEYIGKQMAERSKRIGINQDRVIIELARIALANAGNIINAEDATLKEDATEDDTAAIQSIRVKVIPTKDGEGIEREIKLMPKVKAIELLGRHLGMWNDKIQIEGKIPVVIEGEADLED